MYYSSEEEVVTRLQDKEVFQHKNNFLAETNFFSHQQYEGNRAEEEMGGEGLSSTNLKILAISHYSLNVAVSKEQ